MSELTLAQSPDRRSEHDLTSLPSSSPLDTPLVPTRLIGAHMPTSGGLCNSLLNGHKIGCRAVQLFTGSPRQWSHAPLASKDIDAFHAAKETTGIAFTVAHDSYLINLAAPAVDVLERSRNAFRGELQRAELLGIPWVVTHMGAHLDQGEAAAIARLVESLKLILEETDQEAYRVGVALETTAGQGTGLGWRFEQLAEVLDGVGVHPRLGVCLDTCHVFAAGYDLRDAAAYEATWTEFDRTIGLGRLKVIHANDSKKGLGSRVDRHEHIGSGEIGLDAFRRLVRDPRLDHVPIIIETPDSETMHAVNLTRLQSLVGETTRMTVTVRCFGHYSTVFGGEAAVISVVPGASVRDLIGCLVDQYPALSNIERHCRFAVDAEYVGLDVTLAEGSEVAVLPPMSGG